MWKILRGRSPKQTTAAAGKPGGRYACCLSDPRVFVKLLHIEQKRSERSGNPFVLMLLHCGEVLRADTQSGDKLLEALARATRETDIAGWYREGELLGVIFTEIAQHGGRSAIEVLSAKVGAALENSLGGDAARLGITFYLYPDDWHGQPAALSEPAQYRDLIRDTPSQTALRFKRLLDIAGSLALLVLCAPLMVIIAIAIKLTSPGPIIFRQTRVGQYNRRFTFLKFRSMKTDNDPSIHQAYVARLIAGCAEANGKNGVYKLTNDPRVTRLGQFLRKSSLDELPQLFNVLAGDMSLVGPRPPVPYEVEQYDLWHRQRLLSMKPGITGLWQVKGRSRVPFDEMVRLDLRYARSWSLATDLSILLRTPAAIVLGSGAH